MRDLAPDRNPFPSIRRQLEERLERMTQDEPDIDVVQQPFLALINQYPYIPPEELNYSLRQTYHPIFRRYLRHFFSSLVDTAGLTASYGQRPKESVAYMATEWIYRLPGGYQANIRAVINDDLGFSLVAYRSDKSTPRYWVGLDIWVKFGHLGQHPDNHDDLITQTLWLSMALQLATQARLITLRPYLAISSLQVDQLATQIKLSCKVSERGQDTICLTFAEEPDLRAASRQLPATISNPSP